MDQKGLHVKAAVVIILVFIIGFMGGIGATVTFIAVKNERLPFIHNARPVFGPPHIVLERITQELDLSEEQKDAVFKILKQTRMDLMQIRRMTEPRVRKIIDKTKRDVMSVLDDKQKEKFEILSKDLENRAVKRRNRFNEHEPPPPPPPENIPPL